MKHVGGSTDLFILHLLFLIMYGDSSMVIGLIEKWKPIRYRSHNKFRDDLRSFLKTNLSEMCGSIQKVPAVITEPIGRADLRVGGDIGI